MSRYTQPTHPPNQAANQSPSQTPAGPEDSGFSVALPLSADIAIGLATLPMLAAVLSSQMATRALIELGEHSQELFRGSQLPTLPLLKL